MALRQVGSGVARATDLVLRQAAAQATAAPLYVILGPPGVGKGTYSTTLAHFLQVPHIAAGNLVRHEMKQETAYAERIAALVNSGELVPDSLVLELLAHRLAAGKRRGEGGALLDGFPRTAAQAQQLVSLGAVQLALNLSIREEVLVEKCLGRRVCGQCGKGFNVAAIDLPPSGGRPGVKMPPLFPPARCMPLMETREDDTEPVIRKRLEVYKAEASPVEDFFRQAGLLLDFQIPGGIPETTPLLLEQVDQFLQRRQATRERPPLSAVA